MRSIPVLMTLMLLVSPRLATSQSFELYGSAGPTIIDEGNSFAAGAGLSPASRFTIGFNFERTHISSRTSRRGDVVTSFRGGTLFLGTAELRFAPLGRDRVGPYGLAGVAVGLSHPNVNDTFPNRITNRVNAMFVGGGVHVPVNERLTVFGDVRFMFGGEGNDGIIGVAPVRAGIAWRF